MSNTHKHKNRAKYIKYLLDKTPQKLQNYFDRSNNDWGEFRKAKKDLVDKIAEKELKQQIKTDEYNFKQNGEFIEDIDDPYFSAKETKTEKCTLYTPTTDTSYRCLICGELKWEHSERV